MAINQASDRKKIRNVVLADKLWRDYIISEEKTNQHWKDKWSWLLDEYKELHGKLGELSKNSTFLRDVNNRKPEEDTRNIRPIPESTNHEYGWIPHKPGFNIDRFGPDLDKPLPLPDIYHIAK